MKTGYFALIGRIKRVSQDLEKVVSRTQSLMDKAQRTGDDGYLDDFMDFLRELSIMDS